jgi:hypothetical protein
MVENGFFLRGNALGHMAYVPLHQNLLELAGKGVLNSIGLG